MTDSTDAKLEAAARVADALSRGNEAKRLHWLSIADRLGETEYGAALIQQFSDAILADDEDLQASIALDVARFMERQNAEHRNRGAR